MQDRKFIAITAVCVFICVFVFAGCRKQNPPPAKQTPPAPSAVPAAHVVPAAPAAPAAPETPKPSDTAKQPAPPDSGLVPIPLELPKPTFVGTPVPTNVANLEQPLGKARPPFLAPKGTKNAALGRPVQSTDNEPIIGEISMITDGVREASDGCYVELGPFVQNVTIDLEAQYNIYAVVVWHFHKQAVVYFDVVVQVADDPDFTKNVQTIFNNDIDNSAGLGRGSDRHYVETNEGKLIDARGIKGRYVRLYSNGSNSNDLNHYVEVEVYATPAN